VHACALAPVLPDHMTRQRSVRATQRLGFFAHICLLLPYCTLVQAEDSLILRGLKNLFRSFGMMEQRHTNRLSEARDTQNGSHSQAIMERQAVARDARNGSRIQGAIERQAACVWAKAHIDGVGDWDMCTYPGNLDVYVSRRIQRHGSFEGSCIRDVIARLRAVAKNGQPPVLIDVGGNIGMFSLAAAAAGIETHTFEPVPISAAKIMISAAHNGFRHLVHVYTMGASDEFGRFGMGFAESNQGGAVHAPVQGDETPFVQIPVVPLDKVLPLNAFAPRPVYLKMDIEGGECRALRGLRHFLNIANLVGAVLETNKRETIACCNELVRPPNGAFYILHQRHSLCAHDQASRKRLPFESLCALASGYGFPASAANRTWPVDMIWRPC